MKPRTWIAFSGFLWLGIGVFLLYKGIHFISEGITTPFSLSDRFQKTFGSTEKAATIWIVTGLIIGFLKGRLIFPKTVQRIVHRIRALPLPIGFAQVYPPSYWLLITAMVGLGMLMRILPIPVDARGLIDVAIGSALMNGAMLYFRAARNFVQDVPYL